MQDHQSSTPRTSTPRRAPVVIIAGLAAVGLAIGGGVAWWNGRSAAPEANAPTSTAVSPSPQTAPAQQTVQIYWLKTNSDRIELAPASISVPTNGQPDATLKAAFETMLKGSPDAALTSTIPQNTRLLGLEAKQDGIHVNLSQEFTSGGGSTSMQGRLGQVIYTATAIDPNAKVWLSVEGKPLEVLGGEGLVINQPTSRSDFEQNFSL
ncbi:GerMN domain-containing protein [Leptolyngbya sp. ST-U4]|uniref:GerMN domain-containing protein n=1 Tax=Leptolyngbya sp. ST-U4 TaxID=2933912 RepID=UPI00199F3DB4|nr:GerMN domain-containing protein [Cyanobacteria bacterium FACHB-502]